MPLLTKSKKFKSPLEVNKKVELIMNNAPDVTEILEKDSSAKMENFKQKNKTITPVRSEDKIGDLSYSLNAPGIKEAYKIFFEKASQSSGTSSQRCTPLFDGIAESNSIIGTPTHSKDKESKSLNVEKYDFMKNFKNANKRLKKQYDLKSLSYEEDCIAFEKEESDEMVKKKKQRKQDTKRSGKRLENKEEKRTVKKTKLGQEISIYERMIMIQESRNTGLYALCDKCNKARYLPNVKDPLELPDKWYCHMNPDGKHNDCSDPEEILEDEEFLIENLYNAGSVVWGRLKGWPWWPAMVEDDPDLEQYFWLEENIQKPTYYHVTFFDSKKVTRCWLRPSAIVPFKVNMKNSLYNCPKTSKFYDRISAAKKQAEDAIELPLIDRLKKYSFIQRYNKPLKNKDLKKYKPDKENSRGSKTKRNESKGSSNKKEILQGKDEPFSKPEKNIDHDLKKERKKIRKNCTISSMEDNSDISVTLEDLNEKVNWDFLDYL